MPAAVRLRDDYSAGALRGSRKLLSRAALRDRIDRRSAAKIGAMEQQTLRDWVHHFNASGPDRLIENWTEGPKPRPLGTAAG